MGHARIIVRLIIGIRIRVRMFNDTIVRLHLIRVQVPVDEIAAIDKGMD